MSSPEYSNKYKLLEHFGNLKRNISIDFFMLSPFSFIQIYLPNDKIQELSKENLEILANRMANHLCTELKSLKAERCLEPHKVFESTGGEIYGKT